MQSKHNPIQAHHVNETTMQIQEQQQELEQQQQPTMTVLESLEPVQPQPVLSILDSVQHQQEQELTVIHSMVEQPGMEQQQQQQQQQQQEQPQLHQLQAPTRNHHLPDQQQLELELEQQAHLNHQHHEQDNHQQQQQQFDISRGQQQSIVGEGQRRQHIEGISADGGGPIVQWLLDHYEIADGESLPRSTVYNHYLAHCKQLQMSSVNAASFGKLIRSVFIGLKTRRLGTRGHSKYHYFGVRAKQHVRLEWGHDGAEFGVGGCSSARHNENTDNTDSADDCLSSSSSNKRMRTKRPYNRHHQVEQPLNDPSSNKHGYVGMIETTAAHQQQQDGDSPHHHHHHHHHHHNNNNPHNHHHHLHHQELSAEQNGNHHFYRTDAAAIHHHQQQATTIDAMENHDQINGGRSFQHTKLTSNGISNGHGTSSEHNSNGSNYIWSTAATTNYRGDLADYRNSLGPNSSTLIDDHWPARNDEALFSQQQNSSNGGGGVVESNSSSVIDYHQTINSLNAFEASYKSYYKRMIELLSELKFAEVEQLWFDFWHPAPLASANPPMAAPADATSFVHEGPTTVHWTADDENLMSVLVTTTPAVGAEETIDATPAVANTNSNGTGTMAGIENHEQQHINHHQQEVENHHYNHHHHHQEQQQLNNTRAPPSLNGTVAHLSNSLTFNHLYQLTSQPKVVQRINQIDYCLFQAIEEFLMPELLAPIPRPLVQQLRVFAKQFSNWIELAIKDLPSEFVGEKTRSAQAFGHALLRYTSINHLAVASRAIWDKRTILAQMSSDLNRIDLRDIEHQVSLMCREKEDDAPADDNNHSRNNNDSIVQQDTNNNNNSSANSIDSDQENGQSKSHRQARQRQDHIESISTCANPPVNRASILNHVNHHQGHDRSFIAMQPAQLIQDFLLLLENPYAGDYWSDWCRNLVEFCGHSFSDAKNFILRWNFHISLILKELTLKSASSLGPFQLIKLLFDEYIYYLVVLKLARAQNKTFAQLLKPASAPNTTTTTPAAAPLSVVATATSATTTTTTATTMTGTTI